MCIIFILRFKVQCVCLSKPAACVRLGRHRRNNNFPCCWMDIKQNVWSFNGQKYTSPAQFPDWYFLILNRYLFDPLWVVFSHIHCACRCFCCLFVFHHGGIDSFAALSRFMSQTKEPKTNKQTDRQTNRTNTTNNSNPFSSAGSRTRHPCRQHDVPWLFGSGVPLPRMPVTRMTAMTFLGSRVCFGLDPRYIPLKGFQYLTGPGDTLSPHHFNFGLGFLDDHFLKKR